MNAEAFFVSQAKAAGDAAIQTLHPTALFTGGEAYVRAAELYRRAIQSGIAARLVAAGEDNPVTERVKQAATIEAPLPDLSELLAATPPATLRKWALSNTHLQNCLHHLSLDQDAVTSLDEDARHDVCSDLGAFYRSMLVALAPAESAAEVKRFKRDLGLFALGGLVVVACVWGVNALYQRKLATDLTLDATWSASSRHIDACRSPEQECPESEEFFFCTRQEKNPWLMFDFKTTKTFSAVEVINRQDCCGERAKSLIISVSEDKENWLVVAERREQFKTIDASFPPVSARYLKLEVPEPSAMLHLARVRVFP